MSGLPHAVRTVVERTVAGAQLPAKDRRRVHSELESHFADGLAAGVTEAELVNRFGDPRMTAALIRNQRGRSVRLVRAATLTAGACVAAFYIAAVAALATAAPRPDHDLEADAWFVNDRIAQARAALANEAGVWRAYSIAAELRRRRTAWSECASLVLLADVYARAEARLSTSDGERLRDSLRVLAQQETLIPRDSIIATGTVPLMERLYGTNGRVDRDGLRLLRQAKLGEALTLGARLLEPLYFGLPMSRARARDAAAASWDHGRTRGARAGRSLLARL